MTMMLSWRKLKKEREKGEQGGQEEKKSNSGEDKRNSACEQRNYLKLNIYIKINFIFSFVDI